MNPFERKVTVRVLGIHLGVVALLLMQSAMKGCFRPKPKPEIVTFIEFGSPAPAVNVQKVTKMADPEPQAPEPTPEPEPVAIPDPPKPKPKPKSKPTPKPEPKPEPKPKPKPKSTWKPVDPKDIKIGKPVKDSAPKPTVSAAEITKTLSGIVSPSAATGNPSQFNDYYAQIISLFYRHWTPPASASSASGSTIVRISIRPGGQIVKRSKIKSSGDSIYDNTAMEAANAVSTLPRPPSNFPYDYVEVVFTLDN